MLFNKQGSLRGLNSLNKKFEHVGLAAEYDQIIREQQEQGIIEDCPPESTGFRFYIPHKPAIREEAASTKLREVHDASARAYSDAPSLNECLYPGPVLQNKLRDVLVRQRFYPVVIFGNIQKAFLQIQIKEKEPDALRFLWRINEHSNLDTYRFTRALFPFLPPRGSSRSTFAFLGEQIPGSCCCTAQKPVRGRSSEWWSDCPTSTGTQENRH